jgi:hypothetical protein
MSKHTTHVLSSTLLTLVALFVTSHASADTRVAMRGDGSAEFSDRLSPAVGAALDVPSERANITGGKLQGRWLAQTEDGTTTVLELRPSGAFSFDQQASATPERDYLCGDWSFRSGELSLSASTQKTRLVSGEIVQNQNKQVRSFTVLAARAVVLILRGAGRSLTFYRRGA